MSNNTAPARRVAGTIGVFKWIVIGIQIIFGVILLFAFNAQEDWPVWTAAAGPFALAAFLLSALSTWVVFGWLQHTLGMLTAIAANTRQPEVSVSALAGLH